MTKINLMNKYYTYFYIHEEGFVDNALQNICDDFSEEEVKHVVDNIERQELLQLIQEFNSNIELLFSLDKEEYEILQARFRDMSIALAQVKLMREGKLEKKNIHEFLEELK